MKNRKERKSSKSVITIPEDVRVPGTDILLEKGDRIKIFQEDMRYYTSELEQCTPFLPYDLNFQVKGVNRNGERVSTKWLAVNGESLEAIQSVLGPFVGQ